jgi:hypothetical protein
LTNKRLTELNQFTNLKGLDLADNPEITDEGLRQLERRAFEELSVSGTGWPKNGNAAVTDTGVSALLTNNRNTLTSLNLAGTATLADPNSKAIRAIRQMKNLATLSLAGTGINNAGLREVWRVDKDVWPLTGLLSLDISNTSVTDAGFVDDKGNVGLPNLKTIRIGAADLKITTGGVNRRNAFVAEKFPKEFNLAKLVKSQQ